MAIISREKLKSKFKNGLFPTQDDFASLIDSVLNKRDDHFFGKWQEGRKYCEEDVVIHAKALYMLRLLDDTDNDCPDETGQEGPPTLSTKENNCYCSTTPPNDDANWCLLELKIDDGDWVIVDNGAEESTVMYAKVHGAVGIGTSNPAAKLDISDTTNGQFLFKPNEGGNPAFIINRLGQEEQDGETTAQQYLNSSVNEQYVTWLSNAPLGYIFKIESAVPDIDRNAKNSQQEPNTDLTEPMSLMLITNNQQHARVGIGTTEPAASLDIQTSDKAQVQIHTDGNSAPDIRLFNLNTSDEANQLSIALGNEFAAFTTNSKRGFHFKRASESGDKPKDSDTLVSIDKSGKVGIGTAHPMTQLHVKDNNKGEFRMSMHFPNPTFSIINLKNAYEVNYLVMGVDTDRAKFVTDAEAGFVFSIGKEADKKKKDRNAENINQGKILMQLQQIKKKKVSKKEVRLTPTIDLRGITKTYGNYVSAEKEAYSKTDSNVYTHVLDKLSAITPIAMNWNNSSRIGDIGEQLGLDADELLSDFPQVVMKEMDTTKSIAYERLVPVLIQAINDLRMEVKDLKDELKKKM